jgi:hypothetical protein
MSIARTTSNARTETPKMIKNCSIMDLLILLENYVATQHGTSSASVAPQQYRFWRSRVKNVCMNPAESVILGAKKCGK